MVVAMNRSMSVPEVVVEAGVVVGVTVVTVVLWVWFVVSKVVIVVVDMGTVAHAVQFLASSVVMEVTMVMVTTEATVVAGEVVMVENILFDPPLDSRRNQYLWHSNRFQSRSLHISLVHVHSYNCCF